MTDTNTKLVELAMPAAIGWRWSTTGFDGVYEHEITWIRGTHSLRYGVKGPAGRWVSTAIERPERFGFDGTRNGARAAARAFHEGEES